LGLAVAAVQTFFLWGKTGTDFARMIYLDNYTNFFYFILILGSALTVLLSRPYLEEYGKNLGEYYALVLFATVGMMLMASSAHLIMIFLGLEIMSIAVYVLAGLFREDLRSNEAALKYLVLGAFSSAFLLYGMAMLYGAAGGTLYLSDLAVKLSDKAAMGSPLTLLGIGLLIVGFGFKVAAVPFHFWTPDVYEGAPTPITAFISTASKAAGFAVLLRVMLAVFPAVAGDWTGILAGMATATMTLGNLLALAQKNIKRLLAYSSIAHAGYALIGLVALSQFGAASLVFYLTAYVVTNLAAFAVVILFARSAGSEEIADYAGLSRRSPGLALALMVALLSLAGMPPLAGFVAKFYVFAAAVQSGWIWLAFVGVLNAIVGLYYYLTVLKVVYLYRSENDHKPIAIPGVYAAALVICILAIVLIGSLSGAWLSWALTTAQALF
jgi:NADH-quinone oxidoreductase subunit N